MEDDLIFFLNKDNLKKLMQPQTIKSKTNGCGTAPGNLVCIIYYIVKDNQSTQVLQRNSSIIT